jgi:hypothetical protein
MWVSNLGREADASTAGLLLERGLGFGSNLRLNHDNLKMLPDHKRQNMSP